MCRKTTIYNKKLILLPQQSITRNGLQQQKKSISKESIITTIYTTRNQICYHNNLQEIDKQGIQQEIESQKSRVDTKQQERERERERIDYLMLAPREGE